MKIINHIIFIATFVFCAQLGSGQMKLPDGVTATSSFIDEIKKNYADENAYPFNLNDVSLSVKIPVRVHIVKNISGASGMNTTDIYTTLNNTNNYFKAIGIQFFIDSVNFVNDYNYGYISNKKKTLELLTKFGQENRINLFIVDSIKKGSFNSYGYTYFPNVADSNYIFLNKEYISGNYLTTLMGHFMGLLSTHETLGGEGYANEKNCAISGDFICDTYTDPNLYNQVDVTTCQYQGSQRDNLGKYFVPSVANIMSNSSDNCKCIFTPQQYRRMYYYYVKYRQKLKF